QVEVRLDRRRRHPAQRARRQAGGPVPEAGRRRRDDRRAHRGRARARQRPFAAAGGPPPQREPGHVGEGRHPRALPRRRVPAAHREADRTHARRRRSHSRRPRCRMTAVTITHPAALAALQQDNPVTEVFHDAWSVAKRNLIGLVRTPTTVMFSTIQPIIFVLMFRYVFGGAINIPGVRYVDFLMAGIFVQTVTFGAMNTGVGLATDLQTGIIERFRSLPMARSAVLAGRTIADLVRNLFVVALMVGMGFLVGFRVHTGVVPFALAIVLLLAFGVALSWVMALIGLRTGNAEAAQAAAFPLMAPLVFASSAFVSTRSMPGWLQAYANHQPVTATINAVRALTIGGPTASKVLVALAWMVGITAVFAYLAVNRYRRSA